MCLFVPDILIKMGMKAWCVERKTSWTDGKTFGSLGKVSKANVGGEGCWLSRSLKIGKVQKREKDSGEKSESVEGGEGVFGYQIAKLGQSKGGRECSHWPFQGGKTRDALRSCQQRLTER